MFEDSIQNERLDEVVLKPKAESSAQNRSRRESSHAHPPVSSREYYNAQKIDVSTVFPKKSGRWRRLNYKKLLLTALGIAVFAVIILAGFRIVSWGGKIFQNKSPFSFLSGFGQLFLSNDQPMVGEDKGVVNILLLGIGGEGHEGANLTDTIILASIKLADNKNEADQVSLFSIPRDFIARLPEGLEWRKINSAYAYGELKGNGLGAKWITDIMEDLTGEKIPYYAVVDFDGFRQAIDDLGGVDVYIERSFTDSSFPDYRKGYLPTISFKQGFEHMSGERALEFARSRHGTNNEGTDFARSRRQQKILAATKEKAGKLNLTSISTINKLMNNFADHFRTNLQPWEIKRTYDLLKNLKIENITSITLDPTTGIVCNEIAQETGAYILTYCPQKNKSDLRTFAARRFEISGLLKESPKIVVQNSTKTAGLASQAQNALRVYNFEITSENYPEKREYPLTTIYDLTGGAKPNSLEYLKTELSAYVASSSYPFEDKLLSPKPDFVVVLGTDAPAKIKILLEKNTPKTPAVKEPTASDQAIQSIKP